MASSVLSMMSWVSTHILALIFEEKETADPDVNKDPTSLLESYINDLDTANDDDSEEVEEAAAGGGSEEAVQNKTPIITATQTNQMLKELEPGAIL